MKRHLIPSLIVGLSALALVACSTGSTGSTGATAPAPAATAAPANTGGALAGKKVLYVDALPGNALLDGLAQGLAAELTKQGAKVARVFQLNAQNQIDLAAANQRINEGIAQGVDAIVTFPLDANAIRPGVDAATKAGIPIFTFQALGGLDVTGKVRFPDEAQGCGRVGRRPGRGDGYVWPAHRQRRGGRPGSGQGAHRGRDDARGRPKQPAQPQG